MLAELKNRGVGHPDRAVDGLQAFPDAIETAFPLPRCNCTSCADPRLLSLGVLKGTQGRGQGPEGDLPGADPRGCRWAMEAFDERWDSRFPQISRMWRTHRASLTTFFDYPRRGSCRSEPAI